MSTCPSRHDFWGYQVDRRGGPTTERSEMGTELPSKNILVRWAAYLAYVLLHLALPLYSFVRWCFIPFAVRHFLYFLSTGPDGIDRAKVVQTTRNLGKVPEHLVFVFDERDPKNISSPAALKRISSLICWSLAAGIPYISIFESHGSYLLACILCLVVVWCSQHNRAMIVVGICAQACSRVTGKSSLPPWKAHPSSRADSRGYRERERMRSTCSPCELKGVNTTATSRRTAQRAVSSVLSFCRLRMGVRTLLTRSRSYAATAPRPLISM